MAMVTQSLIRELASSWSGTSVAGVDHHDVVHVWSLDSFSKLCDIPTFPKEPYVHISLNRDSSIVYAGSWGAGGIMAYSVSESRELWRRKELRPFWGISVAGFDSGLYCRLDHSASLRLDPATGQTIEKMRGVGEVFSSSDQSVCLFERRQLHVGPRPGITRFKVPRTTFAVLDTAFSTDCVAVTESGGPVRCFDLDKGTECWRHTPAPGFHFIHLAFCESLGLFVGVEWAYRAGGELRLVSLARNSGASTIIADLPGARDFKFCRSGSLLLSSEGDLVDVTSGKELRRLGFPTEEYEEPEFPSWEERMQTGTPEQRELARLLGPP
jgi:outer membrane protein assembly factor BamB